MNSANNALIWIAKDGESVGPYTQQQIVTMFGNGSLLANTLVCFQGTENWIPVTDVVNWHDELIHGQEHEKSELKARALTYRLLGLFFGMLGLHNFYVNEAFRGVLQVVLTVFGAVFCGLELAGVGGTLWLLVAIWVLVEIVQGPPSPKR